MGTRRFRLLSPTATALTPPTPASTCTPTRTSCSHRGAQARRLRLLDGAAAGLRRARLPAFRPRQQARRHRPERARSHRRRYRGETKVILINHSTVPFEVNLGDRIAQLVMTPFTAPAFEIAQVTEDATDRGVRGFGSTGVATA